MNEAETYYAKENAKSSLLTALQAFLDASRDFDMDDEEQVAEIESVLDEAGKDWEIQHR